MHIAHRALGRDCNRLVDVLLGVFKVVTVDHGNRAQGVAVRRCGLQIDDFSGGHFERRHVALAQGDSGQVFLCVHQIGAAAQSFSPLRLGATGVAGFLQRNSIVVVSEGILGIVLQGGL